MASYKHASLCNQLRRRQPPHTGRLPQTLALVVRRHCHSPADGKHASLQPLGNQLRCRQQTTKGSESKATYFNDKQRP